MFSSFFGLCHCNQPFNVCLPMSFCSFCRFGQSKDTKHDAVRTHKTDESACKREKENEREDADSLLRSEQDSCDPNVHIRQIRKLPTICREIKKKSGCIQTSARELLLSCCLCRQGIYVLYTFRQMFPCKVSVCDVAGPEKATSLRTDAIVLFFAKSLFFL